MPKFRAWLNIEKKFGGQEMCEVKGWDEEGLVMLYDAGDFNWDEVDVMQSTGLKDKNGVEIYEGDILYFEPYETHFNDRVVEYIDGAYHGRLIINGYSKLLAECVYETKVIGNIYENPELLEVAE